MAISPAVSNQYQSLISQLNWAKANNPRLASEIEGEISALTGRYPDLMGGSPTPGGDAMRLPVAPPMSGGTPSAQVNPLVNEFRSQFANLPYFNTEAFQSLMTNFARDPGKYIRDSGNISDWQPVIRGYGDTFSQIFKNYVGRDPNNDEYNQFFSSVVLPKWQAAQDPNELRQTTEGLISQFYGRTAAEESQKRAEEQAQAAVKPGSAFDVWANQYRQSISDTEKSLMDYQSRLFEKLRPQLLTSLQSQGLLNTGALNEAFSGAAKDLADESSNFIASARGAAEQDIANRRFDIASQPTNYALQREFNTVPNIEAAGRGALQNVWSSVMQDRAFEQQMKLLDRQQASKPSLLSQYGGLLVGGVASGLGQRMGQYMGKY